EPDPDDAEMFYANVFSYASRQRMSEHAYRATLRDLSARRGELVPLLARHGLALREAVLDAPDRGMMANLPPAPRGATEATTQLRRALDDLAAEVGPRGT